MEAFGVFADGEWESLGKMFSAEEFDYTQQFLGQCNAFPQLDYQGLNFITPSSFCPTSEANLSMAGVSESLFCSSNTLNPNLQNLSQDSSFGSDCSTTVFIPHETAYFVSDSNHYAMTKDVSMSMDICIRDEKKIGLHGPAFHNIAMEETASPMNKYTSGDKSGNLDNGQPAAGVFPAKELELKRKFDVPALHIREDDRVDVNSSENKKKKPRVSRNKNNEKRAQSKKNQNLSPKGNDGEESIGGSDGQSSSSYSSEEDNASQETNGGSLALNLNGKPRASRGSATDPQSIYARKRRARINERLKILQNLVPNGTKVDISTMLEEAVHHVKFLQLQIKLLSSDDLWMYAPIAYNGIDVFLNQKISPLL